MTAALLAATDASGSALASWTPLVTLLIAFGLAVAALVVFGRAPEGRPATERLLLRAPRALQRLTGIPGWAAAAIGTSLFGLLVAGQGFYSDVAWHIALGRDEEVFTAPHTAIVLGLLLITAGAVVGTMVATLERVDTGLRWGGLRVPWSMVPLGLLGASAVSGFPLDEVWHREYGIDVTMWSPTHMLMILGASFTGLASWLILADARVRPRDSRWARGVHVVAAWLTLQGLVSAQGEFNFGVPQFQQLFHPVLVCLAAGCALVAIRLVHGRGWVLGIVVGSFLLENSGILDGAGDGPVTTREGGLFLVSAVVVEAVAWLLGTERRLRFALVSGLGVGTLGLAGEWLWNTGAHQPWTTNLLPDALVLGVVAATAAAVIGAAFGSAVAGEGAARGIPTAALVVAGLAVLVVLALPMPRQVGDVSAEVTLDPVSEDEAYVEVTLTPADAAEDARWFQATSWQGGGLVLAEMEEVGPGRYVSEEPVSTSGRAKTLLRLHRGAEMMAVPVYLPADPEIGEPEIPAVDRTAPFESEKKYLLRETQPGGKWLEYSIYGLLTVVGAGWVTALTMAAARVGRPAGGDRDQAVQAASRVS